jgi:hypothetical protein
MNNVTCDLVQAVSMGDKVRSKIGGRGSVRGEEMEWRRQTNFQRNL